MMIVEVNAKGATWHTNDPQLIADLKALGARAVYRDVDDLDFPPTAKMRTDRNGNSNS